MKDAWAIKLNQVDLELSIDRSVDSINCCDDILMRDYYKDNGIT